MRKLFIILASLFTVLSVVFVFLPLGTLALLPIALALIFGYLTFKKSDENQKQLPKMELIVAGLCLLAVIGKEILIKDEVAQDTQFEQTKVETKKEAKKELEELEGLE
jgi:hypothetical protein